MCTCVVAWMWLKCPQNFMYWHIIFTGKYLKNAETYSVKFSGRIFRKYLHEIEIIRSEHPLPLILSPLTHSSPHLFTQDWSRIFLRKLAMTSCFLSRDLRYYAMTQFSTHKRTNTTYITYFIYKTEYCSSVNMRKTLPIRAKLCRYVDF